jgi:hypothetical protein
MTLCGFILLSILNLIFVLDSALNNLGVARWQDEYP